MTAPVVELRGLCYRYPGAVSDALTDIDLTIGPGELVVLAGESGSGKSTLLRALSGLVPHFHGGLVSGSARVTGLDTREHGPGELARGVGTLFQDPETQVVMGTVRAELAFALENRGEPQAAIARAVEEVALALAIDPLLSRSTAELSGGELQRVALGATLAGRPALALLDEPTSQLDPVAGDELIGLLRRLNEDSDLTIVLAEHRLERCLPAADRVIVLDAGRIACDAPPAEFLAWALEHAPALATPGAALLAGVGLAPMPGVRAARAALRKAGALTDEREDKSPQGSYPPSQRATAPSQRATAPSQRATAPSQRATAPSQRATAPSQRATAPSQRATAPSQRATAPRPAQTAALTFKGVWHELHNGPQILRDVSLSIGAGERVALMGANGAGKSTLLRHASGLMKATRGKVQAGGRVALLLQNPTDYLVHDTVAAEGATPATLELVGLDPRALADRHPRDLSGGEKQRLALAIVLGDMRDGPDQPAVVALDEPTRGMDRGAKQRLASLLRSLPAAVIVATHDPEFVASFADRVILVGDGTVIADGTASEILSGGTYFATETARILGGAGGALRPEQGIALLRGDAAQASTQATPPVVRA